MVTGTATLRPRHRALALFSVLALALALLAGGGRGALAAPPTAQTVTFGCLGFPQYFSVPTGVTQLTVTVAGAAGAANKNTGAAGKGGTVSGTLAVTPGDLLTIAVGCTSGFGFSRGGNGGFATAGLGSANGGGATGFTINGGAAPALVAGGGGGGGGVGFFLQTSLGGDGGDGGQPPADGTKGKGPGAGAGGAGGGSGSPTGGDGTAATKGSGGGAGSGGGGGYPHGGAGGKGGGVGTGGGGGGGGGESYSNPAVVTGAAYGTASAVAEGALTLSYTGAVAGPQLFTCTNSGATYTVPDGINALLVTMIGGDGGFRSATDVHAVGAGVQALVAVTPGETLAVGTGCAGQLGTLGTDLEKTNPGGAGGYGYSGGGHGGDTDKPPLVINLSQGGGGGGGASGIGRGTQPLVVAGGGGGDGSRGNTIGCTNGRGGNADANGTDAKGCANHGTGGAAGGAGVGGNADGGAGCSFCSSGGGGGGGGGYANGAGGTAGGVGLGGGGGGGGGTSYLQGQGVSGGSFFDTQGYRAAQPQPGFNDPPALNGLVVITPLSGLPPSGQVATTTTLTVLPDSVPYSTENVAVQATVVRTSDSLAVAEGAVTFTLQRDGIAIGPSLTAPVVAGLASATLPLGLAVGAAGYTVTATYGGGLTFGPSAALPVPLTVRQVATALTLVVPATAAYGDTAVTITATVRRTAGDDGLVPDGSPVTFTFQGRTYTATTTGGVATLALPLAGANAGTYRNAIGASYAGDENHRPAAATGSLTITRRILLIKATDRTVGLRQPNPANTPPANCVAQQTATAACWLELAPGSSFVNGDDWGDLNLTNLRFTYSRNYPNSNATETVGKQYKISATGFSSANYDLRFVQGTLTVVAP